MNFLINIDIKKPFRSISYREKIMLTGSCFTEHIGNALKDLKFSVYQNPHGILFDPASVCRSLHDIVQQRAYSERDLFMLNETWNSWNHHSRFSNTDPVEAVRHINQTIEEAREFLSKADWVVITLGSSFSYRLTELVPDQKGEAVANCHRAPAQWFQKHMLSTAETVQMMEQCCRDLLSFNPNLKFIFTVSPVRHIRDGVVENNRSKGRLLEAVHQLNEIFPQSYYFPAYELVIDVLRDYRFYDIDLVHPNYAATEYVLEQFTANCLDEESLKLTEEVRKIFIARKHRAFQPATQAHRQFLTAHYEKTKLLQEKHPYLDFSEELTYFAP